MKYCVYNTQPKKIIQMADEIKFYYKDRGIVIDFVEDYPEKDLIIILPKNIDLNKIPWEDWKVYNEKSHIILGIEDLKLSNLCKQNNIDFYWIYPATTWGEIRSLLYIGVSQILIGGSLLFQLDKLKANLSIPLRAVPNLATPHILPRENGINGEYIRPEDLQLYEGIITSIEFITTDLVQEGALLEIYKSGIWNGNLNLLITNLKYDVDNRGIADDFGSIRSTCSQRCMMNPNNCHYCNNAVLLCRTIDKNRQNWKLGVGLANNESV